MNFTITMRILLSYKLLVGPLLTNLLSSLSASSAPYTQLSHSWANFGCLLCHSYSENSKHLRMRFRFSVSLSLRCEHLRLEICYVILYSESNILKFCLVFHPHSLTLVSASASGLPLQLPLNMQTCSDPTTKRSHYPTPRPTTTLPMISRSLYILLGLWHQHRKLKEPAQWPKFLRFVTWQIRITSVEKTRLYVFRQNDDSS